MIISKRCVFASDFGFSSHHDSISQSRSALIKHFFNITQYNPYLLPLQTSSINNKMRYSKGAASFLSPVFTFQATSAVVALNIFNPIDHEDDVLSPLLLQLRGSMPAKAFSLATTNIGSRVGIMSLTLVF